MKTGLIIAGHGALASGLYNALKLLSTHMEDICYLDLKEGEDEVSFSERLKKLSDQMQDCQKIFYLIDLAGSIPYKAASEIKQRNAGVIAGINLGMLIEINTMRMFTSDPKEIIENALLIGKEQIVAMEPEQ